MNWRIRWSARLASSMSLAFSVVTMGLVFGSNAIGTEFLVPAKNLFPFFGIFHILVQVVPLSIKGFHEQPAAHDYVFSCVSLCLNILTLAIASLVMKLNSWGLYIGLYAIGFALIDVAMLGIAWAGERLARAAHPPAAAGAHAPAPAGGGGHGPAHP